LTSKFEKSSPIEHLSNLSACGTPLLQKKIALTLCWDTKHDQHPAHPKNNAVHFIKKRKKIAIFGREQKNAHLP
jgi:hypothetical protein